MSWAAKRRLVILIILGALGIAIISVVLISTFTKAPSCTDRTQNQEESGIDCGGPCPYLCTTDTQPPTVLFTKALPNTLGRTDVIAVVENKNARAAARAVPYRLTLFGKDQLLIQDVTGTIDLPPGTKVPVYIPGIVSGQQVATRAFITLDEDAPRWYSSSREEFINPLVASALQTGTEMSPRIEAKISNPSTSPLFQILVIAMVKDIEGNIIAASQTIVPHIEPQGEEVAVFTWNTSFTAPVGVIDVVPVVSLK